MGAGQQQHPVSRVSCVTADPAGAEGAAGNSEPAPGQHTGRRKGHGMGHKDQQSFLHVLRHHCVTVSTLHLHGMDLIEM